MNDHYKDAVDGLSSMKEATDGGVQPSEAMAMTVILARATLAVAEEQAKTNALLETANHIAYAQLCHNTREGDKFMKARRAADKAMRRATKDQPASEPEGS